MTMKNPLDGELQAIKPKFDPAKMYRYTWPGQPPKMVSGQELADLCRGADHTTLAIEECDAPKQRSTTILPEK